MHERGNHHLKLDPGGTKGDRSLIDRNFAWIYTPFKVLVVKRPQYETLKWLWIIVIVNETV